MSIWFRINTGNWNNDPTANPATNTGGFPIGTVNEKFYPTLFVSGDAGVTGNFSNVTLSHSAPIGFQTGWPNESNTGYTTLDPSTLYGNGILSDGNTLVSGSAFGACQAFDGHLSGSYYFEIKFLGHDIFTSTTGGGIGRQYPPMDYNFYQAGGQFYSGNTGGGVIWRLGSIVDNWLTRLYRNGSELGILANTINANDVVGIAVTLDSFDMPGVQGSFGIGSLVPDHIDGGLFLLGQVICNEYTDYPENRDVLLRLSDDAGATWSSGRANTLGQPGEYNTNLQWQKLGQARSRIFELSWDAVIDTAIVSVFVLEEDSTS